MVNMADDNDS